MKDTDLAEEKSLSALGLQVHLLRSREAILAMQDALAEFAEICGQAGALTDLAYFLDKPGAFDREPALYLLSRVQAGTAALQAQDLQGAFLLFEYRVLRWRTGAYTTNDRSGLSTLVALAERREEVGSLLIDCALQGGAQLILFSFRRPPTVALRSTWSAMNSTPVHHRTRERVVPDYLELAPTYDLTLASIGPRTRSNMRYYRRRAERELGCVFVPEATIGAEELRTFNKACMYAVSNHLAEWRLSALASLDDPILAGIKDRNGQWLALLGGRRQGDASEILWQMNRNDLPQYSISLVLRSYLIEQEVLRGAKRFSIEGGTPHPISQSFRPASITDALVFRRTLRTRSMLEVASRLRGISNELMTLLVEASLDLKAVGTGEEAQNWSSLSQEVYVKALGDDGRRSP